MKGMLSYLSDSDFGKIGANTDSTIPYLRFSPDAQTIFNEWLSNLELEKLRKLGEEPVIVEHLSKYRSLMPSIALLIHLMESATGMNRLEPVSAKSARSAVAWCEYLESHARRIYGMLESIEERGAAHLLTKIKKGFLISPFDVRTVRQKSWQYLDDPDVIEGACELLIDHGWLRIKPALPNHGRPGRRPAEKYEINPAALEKKAD